METSNLSMAAGAAGLLMACEEADTVDPQRVGAVVAWEVMATNSTTGVHTNRCSSPNLEEELRVVSEWVLTTRRAKVRANSRRSFCKDSSRWGATTTKYTVTTWEVIRE